MHYISQSLLGTQQLLYPMPCMSVFLWHRDMFSCPSNIHGICGRLKQRGKTLWRPQQQTFR